MSIPFSVNRWVRSFLGSPLQIFEVFNGHRPASICSSISCSASRGFLLGCRNLWAVVQERYSTTARRYDEGVLLMDLRFDRNLKWYETCHGSYHLLLRQCLVVAYRILRLRVLGCIDAWWTLKTSMRSVVILIVPSIVTWYDPHNFRKIHQNPMCYLHGGNSWWNKSQKMKTDGLMVTVGKPSPWASAILIPRAPRHQTDHGYNRSPMSWVIYVIYSKTLLLDWLSHVKPCYWSLVLPW